ncbi:MAG: transposase [Spiroplasma phoeniceum]|nr:MAG: transposase [Spiroplasma phoeniceum]
MVIKEFKKNHNNVIIPKKTKKNPLNKVQKQRNRIVSKMRIIIENIFAILKKFGGKKKGWGFGIKIIFLLLLMNLKH